MNESEREQQGNLRIGAVARLTGVSVHTLRKWEERYNAVEPRRTEGGERIYTHEDLERLGLIKRLGDAGLSLREIARLSLDELAQTWDQVARDARTGAGQAPRRVRVATLGSGVGAMLSRRSTTSGTLDVVAIADDVDTLDEVLAGRSVDGLLYECPTVGRNTPAALREAMERLDVRTAVVIYRFGARGDLLALQAPDVMTLRAPTDPATLEQVVVGLVHPGASARESRGYEGHPLDAAVPPPRLSRAVIARVARTAPRMRCECPHHLADLVLSLRAFEEYSADCEDRNPEDAALHHYLWRSAAQARALFEEAIERVAEVEGIRLEE